MTVGFGVGRSAPKPLDRAAGSPEAWPLGVMPPQPTSISAIRTIEIDLVAMPVERSVTIRLHPTGHGRQELDDPGGKLVRQLHTDHVRDVGPDLGPRVRHIRLEMAGRRRDPGNIDLPGDRQDRTTDLVEALRGWWIEADQATRLMPELI